MPSPGITAMRFFAVTMATLAQRCEFIKLHFHVNSWHGRARTPVAPLMLFLLRTGEDRIKNLTTGDTGIQGPRGYSPISLAALSSDGVLVRYN